MIKFYAQLLGAVGSIDKIAAAINCKASKLEKIMNGQIETPEDLKEKISILCTRNNITSYFPQKFVSSDEEYPWGPPLTPADIHHMRRGDRTSKNSRELLDYKIKNGWDCRKMVHNEIAFVDLSWDEINGPDDYKITRYSISMEHEMGQIAMDSQGKYIGFNTEEDDKIYLLDKWLESDEARGMIGFSPVDYFTFTCLCGKYTKNFLEVCS
jgi:hypothetical protein